MSAPAVCVTCLRRPPRTPRSGDKVTPTTATTAPVSARTQFKQPRSRLVGLRYDSAVATTLVVVHTQPPPPTPPTAAGSTLVTVEWLKVRQMTRCSLIRSCGVQGWHTAFLFEFFIQIRVGFGISSLFMFPNTSRETSFSSGVRLPSMFANVHI